MHKFTIPFYFNENSLKKKVDIGNMFHQAGKENAAASSNTKEGQLLRSFASRSINLSLQGFK